MTETRHKILIVEDDQDLRNIVSFRLEADGHEVLAARNGEEALSILKQELPCLILLDVMMPDINGFEVCKRIKESPSTKDIPVIFMTALDDPDSKVKAFQAGAIDYVPKPFHFKELHARIRSVLKLKESQEALQASTRESARQRDFLENILRSMLEALVVCDGKGTIVRANAAMRELSGYADEELSGMPAGKLFGESCSDPSSAKMLTLYEMGFVRDDAMTLIARSGERIPIAFSASLMKDEEGEPVGIVAVAKDMREIRHLQEQLLRSEKMAALGELAARVANEIRQRLGGISTAFRYIRYKKKLEEDHELATSVQRIESEVARGARLASDLRLFASPHEPALECLSVNDLVEQSLRAAEEQTLLRNVRLEKHLSPSIPDVEGDALQLQDVLLGIMMHAAEMMPRSAILEVSTSTQPGESAPWAVISFTEHGNTLSEEERLRIFDPFTEDDKSMGLSTGLGLAAGYAIIRRHGGMIDIESSAEEKTSTFRVKLPAHAVCD